MLDPVFFMSLVLFAIAVGFGLEYYRHIIKVKREYEKAKSAFNDMILSFNRELRRVAENIERVVFKVETSSTRSEEALDRMKEMEEKLKALEDKLNEPLKNWSKVVSQVNDLEKQVGDITASTKELSQKVSRLEETTQKSQAMAEPGVETVIPIKREKVLAPLTETELAVLELLASEGPKTAPEVKDKIKLSREHTARLMKKLYEDGYLERDSSKIPFRYSIKKEMEKILRRTETEAS